jgi:hypothetical protein
MKVIFVDTRAFSMARTPRCNRLGILTLFLVAGSFGPMAPAMARDADDVLLPMQITAPMTGVMTLIRPQPRPGMTPVVFEVTPAASAAPVTILAPQPLDRGRIRATWAIGVFR